MKKFISHGEEETINLGLDFARSLKPGDVVALFGNLGSGKTKFVQGICKGLGVHEHVASPTFTIVNEYRVRDMNIYHLDFYRIKSLAEIRDIGFEEYLYGNGICLIEWAEKGEPLLPAHRYDVHFSLGGNEQTREIIIKEEMEVDA